jgi:hypothetical protein
MKVGHRGAQTRRFLARIRRKEHHDGREEEDDG